MYPSLSQAKTLAGLFANDGKIKVSSSPESFNSPTVLVLIEHGWLKPTSEVGTWPNGGAYQVHVISRDGIDALQKCLSDAVQRMKRLESAA